MSEAATSQNDTGPTAESTHLLFVSKPTGYELHQADGDPPQPGTPVRLDEDAGTYFVSKVGTSPLPMDKRRCAYLQAQPR